MDRVVVTAPILGLCHMQVCAVKDATDEEILTVCNKNNPSGTTNGWAVVIRSLSQADDCENLLPIQCEDFPDRQHLLIYC